MRRAFATASFPVTRAIEAKLATALPSAVSIDVRNESHMHNVPKDSETHFKVVLVDESFAGTSRVARHRAVMGWLGEELRDGVHALSIIAKTPAEFGGGTVQPSPSCRGGGAR